jgi:hypothetical protein
MREVAGEFIPFLGSRYRRMIPLESLSLMGCLRDGRIHTFRTNSKSGGMKIAPFVILTRRGDPPLVQLNGLENHLMQLLQSLALKSAA